MALDIVFSLDSVITAVGMAEEISIMVLAVVLAVVVSAARTAIAPLTVDRPYDRTASERQATQLALHYAASHAVHEPTEPDPL